MQTNFREHFLWSIFLTPFAFQYLNYSFSINTLIFISHFIAGGIFPDLDLCLDPLKFPRVKSAIYFCKAFGVAAIFWQYPALFSIQNVILCSALWLNFYLIINLVQKTGLFTSIGCKPAGFHRESLFHSMSFWYLCLFAVNRSMLTPLIMTVAASYAPVMNQILILGLKPLAYGAVAHILLDHIGSALQYKDFFTAVQLLSSVFFITLYEYFLFGTNVSLITDTLKKLFSLVSGFFT